MLSSRCASQPASAAIARSAAMIRSQTPAAVQRWSRRQAVRQFISSGGRSRHGAPVLASQSTASMNVRWSSEGRPVRGFWGGSKGARRCHIASLSMVLIVTPPRCDQITSPLSPLATRPSVAGPDPTIGPWHGHDTPNRLYHNEGGRFSEVTLTPINGERASGCVEASDINGDGWIDLLFCAAPNFSGNDGRTGNQGSGVFTYLNLNGKFQDVTQRTPYATANPVQIELGDVDRDRLRRPDLIMIERDQMTIRLNRGGNNPFPAVDYRMPLTSGHDVALGDVNRDGMPDIYIVQSSRGSVNAPDVMLINDGGGTAFHQLPLPNTSIGQGDAVTTIPKWNRTGRAAFLVTNGRLKHAGPVQLITFSAAP